MHKTILSFNFLPNKLNFYLLLFIFSAQQNCFSQIKKVENEIKKIAEAFEGKVGVSILNLSTNEKISVNANKKFPMQSVYKFPLALAMFNEIDKGKFKLNQKINLQKSDLLPNTHSPLREKYPNGINGIELKEIIENTVALSDNNGCDFQFRLLGGCKIVDSFIKKNGIRQMAIVGTEEEMHKIYKMQYRNYSTPNAMTELFTKFYQKKILSEKSTDDLLKILFGTSTGQKRIKGLLPKNTKVAHKTGSSGGDDKGFTEAINDAGLVVLPNNEVMAITLFVSDTHQKSEKSDELMAKISKMAYDYFVSK